MEVGIAVRKGNPDVGVIVADRVVHSDFSFDKDLQKLLRKTVKVKGWEYDRKLDSHARGVLKRAISGEDVFDWSVVGVKSRQVLRELRKVKGTITYGELAKRCGTGARAVGRIMNRNPFAPFVPCHRVLAKNNIGGFASGTENKKKMLRLDGHVCK